MGICRVALGKRRELRTVGFRSRVVVAALLLIRLLRQVEELALDRDEVVLVVYEELVDDFQRILCFEAKLLGNLMKVLPMKLMKFIRNH